MDNPDRTRSAQRFHRMRYLERLTAFSDGVVAIALTLLVLPLVEIVPPDVAHGQTVLEAISDNQAMLWSFGVTFLVIAALWMAHSRLFVHIAEYDGFVVWVNLAYLFAIVSLPFPSKWLQVEGFSGGVGAFYFLVLAVASAALSAISWHVARHPELLTESAADDPDFLRTQERRWFFTVYFAVGFVLAIPLPDWAGWYLLALFPATLVWHRWMSRMARGEAGAQNP